MKLKTDYKINVMIKKYTQFLFLEFGLDFRVNQLGREQFEILVQKHPKLYTIYIEGFHSCLWERTKGKHWKDL